MADPILPFDVVPFELTWFEVELFGSPGSERIWISVHWPGPGGDVGEGCIVALDSADPQAEAYLQRVVTALASLGSSSTPNRAALGAPQVPVAYPYLVDARDAARMTVSGAIRFLSNVSAAGDVLRRGRYYRRACPHCPPECSLDLEGIASGLIAGPGRDGRPYADTRFHVTTVNHENAFQRSARIWVSGPGRDGVTTQHCTLLVRLNHPEGEANTNRVMTALVALGAHQEPIPR